HDLSSDRWSRTHDPIRSGECSANIDSESATGGSSATPFVPDSLDVRRKHAPEVFGDISQLRSQTSRSRLPQRPGRVRGLAGPDGGRDAVHLRRPVADQDRPYVAVVQDGATPAPRVGKPQRAAAVSISAVITDLGWVNCAMLAGVG